MEHNKQNLQEGEYVILDKGKANSSEVVIFKLTPLQMFATVYSVEKTDEGSVKQSDMWDVMTSRLSKLEQEIILVPCAFCDGQIDLAKEEHCPKCNHSVFEDPKPPTDFMVLVNRVALQLCDVNHKTGGHGDLSDLGNEIGIAIGEYHEENNLQYDIKDFINGLKHGLSLTNGTHG
jgi:hypothetical protein